MSFIIQTWQVLVKFLNLCWPTEEPIFAVKTPEPNVFLNRIDQIDRFQSNTLNNPSTLSTQSTPSTISIQSTPQSTPSIQSTPLSNQSTPPSTQITNDSSQMRLQIPAFEPSEISQNSNLLIIGPKMTGKTTLAQTIIRAQYLDPSSDDQSSNDQSSDDQPNGLRSANCEAEDSCSVKPSSNTRILIITNELRDWSKDLGVPVTVLNSRENTNAHFVQKIKFFVADYLIERELNDTCVCPNNSVVGPSGAKPVQQLMKSCQAVVVFDETLTSELYKYPVIYNLLTSHQLNVIIINQQKNNFPSSIFKQIDYYYLLAGAQLSSTLKMPIWNDILREKVPEDIVKYFELFQVGRFLTINNGGYGWIDSEIE